MALLEVYITRLKKNILKVMIPRNKSKCGRSALLTTFHNDFNNFGN